MGASKFGSLRRTWPVWLTTCFLIAASGVISPAALAQKYTPYDPEVQEMVERGIGFIENSLYREVGAQSLHAIAICEASKRYHGKIPADHALVQRAIDGALVFTLDQNGETYDNNTMYEPCIASILLGIVDPEKYAANIQAVLAMIERRQMPSGCWKYRQEIAPPSLGDTSQTQYCCLAIWMASKAGHRVKTQTVEQALQWLTQTQTTDGGWAYRATASSQRPTGGDTLSMTAAGAGAIQMLLDAVDAKNIFGPKGSKRAGADLPAFITEYSPEAVATESGRMPTNANIDTAAVKQCMSGANQYFGRNFVTNASDWTYYYLYGFERYAYFREQADGDVHEIPDWYDQGVEFLKSTQQADGSWHGVGFRERGVVPTVTTAFAVLFLVRSTELLANDPAKGTMTGGQGLPKGNLKSRGQKIYGEALNRDVDEFLELVAQGDNNIEMFADSLTTIVFPDDPAKRELYMGQLRLLVTDNDAYKRLIAVKSLATSRDLNNVPALLRAMKDVEPEIKLMAHQGLRFISRKMDSIKLPSTPSESDFLAARDAWVEWYQSIRPDDRQLID